MNCKTDKVPVNEKNLSGIGRKSRKRNEQGTGKRDESKWFWKKSRQRVNCLGPQVPVNLQVHNLF